MTTQCRVMTIQADERFKATAHGLVIGATLPVFGYNIMTRNRRNIIVYTIFLGFELWNVYDHITCARRLDKGGN